MTNRLGAVLACAAALLIVPAKSPAKAQAAGPSPAKGDDAFLQALAATRGFALGLPTRLTPSPDGREILFLRSPPRDPTLSLFAYDVESGQTRELVSPRAVLAGAEEKLSVAERARRERQRIVDRGITGFEISQDGALVLFSLSGQLYLHDRTEATKGVRALPPRPTPVIDPRLAPHGRAVAYVRGFDLFVADTRTGKERRLTRGGTAEVSHGLAEFVAQEEMGRQSGHFWSPDGRFVAYTEVDQRPLERFTIAAPVHPERPANTFPYPRAGKANARVRLGVIPSAGGATRWIRWDRDKYPYLARVIWKEKGAPLTLLVQTRDQREQVLLAADPVRGTTRSLLVEKDDAWVELDDDLPRWLPGGEAFLTVSERSGGRALELRARDGSLRRELVSAAQGFHGLAHLVADGSRAFVLTATPVRTRLWEIKLDIEAPPTPLDLPEGEHRPVFAKHAPVLVDAFTSEKSPPAFPVYRQNGKDWARVGALPAQSEKPPFSPNLELVTVGSEPKFHAAIVRPRAFVAGRKPRRYPVIVNVYGGPTSLTVRANQRHYLLAQWIADRGAVVVSIDNRGTPRRDRAWSRAIKGDFGKVPLEDQVAGLRALAARFPELDLARVGIYGWSFGGYMAAMAAMRRPDIYKVAVSGAPVVDWLDYDTHYTERYLDLPQANPEGYVASSLLTHATSLRRPLLLIHGTTDDNVYFFHTLKLADALFRAGKPFELIPLLGTHQVPDPVVRQRLWQRIADFLLQHL